MKEQELSALKESAVYSAAHWAKTGFGYFTMRDKVNAYIDATGIKQTTAARTSFYRHSGSVIMLIENLTPALQA